MSNPEASGVRLVAKTRTSEYHVRDDGIVVQTVVTPGKMSIDDAQANTRMFEQIGEGDRRRLLVDMLVPFSTEPGVREWYASEAASRRVAAMAMVTRSSSARIIGNFFLAINRPAYPCRMFADVDSAVAWLLRQPSER